MEKEIHDLLIDLEYILLYDQGFIKPDSSKTIRKIAAKTKVFFFLSYNCQKI